MGKNLLAFSLILGALLLQNIALSQVYRLEAAFLTPPAFQQQKWSERIIRFMSFGQWPAVVEWLWMRSLQDIELNHVAPGSHATAFYDIDLATDMDPAFFKAYFFGSLLLTVVRNDNHGARILLEKAHEFGKKRESYAQDSSYGSLIQDYPKRFWRGFWSAEWRVSQLLGYLNLFEFNQLEKANHYFSQAARFERAPPYLKRMGVQLSSKEGRYRLALTYLQRTQKETDNPLLKESLRKKERHLQVAYQLFQIDREFRSYLNAQASYRQAQDISSKALGRYWKRFVRSNRVVLRDFMGGRIYLDDNGQVVTTSRVEPVLKL